MHEKLGKYPLFPYDATKVVIYGGGGLSKMIIETCEFWVPIRSRAIDDTMKPGETVIGCPVLGSSEILPDLYNKGIRMAVNSVGGVGNYRVRLNIFQQLADAGFVCPVIIHPTAHIDPSARLDAGVLVLAQSYVRQCRLVWVL
jgi:hypothetical protein